VLAWILIQWPKSQHAFVIICLTGEASD